ncbi:nucleotidyltransferase [Micromonospora sp. NBC_01699]|uniref:nucleotidyltransferase domain-containing protein n=1 Tax=Micromonospora sp. NBC_01699 TaxID=2975984 RepID=UPI002E37C987|nr:nucleotidyltransferase [Micromonospora sp. NBC_01699]
MDIEDKLSGWTLPSSVTEQDKQDRTERMIRAAIKEHAAFNGCDLKVYAKGSYANNTNVKADSDVDIAVQCSNLIYWETESSGANPPASPYAGIWTPAKFRSELGAALRTKFPGQVDSSGSTAFRINSGSARVEADVVPCFDYHYYFTSGGRREGTKVFKKDNSSLINYPTQQLQNGKDKNNLTRQYYKKTVRIMKRVENAMVIVGTHREVPSFFIECLVYSCPDEIFLRSTWTETVRGIIAHIWGGLQGGEPSVERERWREVNECKYLFDSQQSWNRADGRDFAKAAWNYLGFHS